MLSLGVALFTVTLLIVVLQVVPRCHSLRLERIDRGDASGVRVRWGLLQLDGRNVHYAHQPLRLVRAHAGLVCIAARPPGHCCIKVLTPKIHLCDRLFF